MKLSIKISGVLAVLGGFLFAVSESAAQEIEFKKLEAKLKIDRGPLEAKGGVVVSYADVIELVKPSVVTIYSTKEVTAQATSPMFEDPFFRRFFGIPDDMDKLPPRKEQGLGSGVIISADGYILTNNHVVGGAEEIMVSLSRDKKDYQAKVVGADPQSDVALIKIDAKGLTPITIGASSNLRVGDVTLAIGNPFGLEQTVTSGIVSALGRSSLNITQGGYENFIQTDASINRGNSGGALIDANGRLIGINTAIQSGMTGGNVGIGFAIPSDMALNIVQRLLENGGEVKRGFLGVYLKELDSNLARALGREDKSGVLITEVGSKTPAEKAGLKAGDLIVRYNDKPIDSMPRLRLDISNTAPGKKVKFEVVRGEENKTIEVTLGDLSERAVAFAAPGRPSPEAEGKQKPKELIAGVRVRDLEEEIRTTLEIPEDTKGVIVESVAADSSAAEAGLAAGQIITQINQKDVDSVQAANAAIKGFKGDVLLLQVFTEGRRDILAIEMKKDE